jgi:hypothetical protein
LDQEKTLNGGLFPVYEAVRLWLKERMIVAPFRKIVISLEDHLLAAKRHGSLTVALGICKVTEAVCAEDFLSRHGDHTWTCHRVLDGLEHISSGLGWRCEELVSHVQQISGKAPPCSHRFARLCRLARNGVACEVLLEADVGTSIVKVRFSAHGRVAIEVVVASRPGPLWVEDDYPVAAARIDKGHFLLLAKDRSVLARVAIPDVAHG